MGSSSVTGDETILFADNMSFDGTARGGKMTMDGQLWIGSGTARHVRKGTLSGSNGITIVNGPGTITIQGSGGTVTGTGTDNHIVRWNGTGVPAIQDSSVVVNDSGQVQAPDGTVAAPIYSFTSELGTGIYLNGAQNLGFSVLGTLRENINETRRRIIGIGDAITITTNAGDIVGSAFDVILGVTDTSAPRSVTLPNSSLVGGQYFIIKDMSGGAGTNNITVSVTGGTKTIDGQTSQLIDTNYGAMTVFYDGSNYFII